MHQRPATLSGHEEHRDRGLPLVELLVSLRKIGDVLACIEQGVDLATIG
jgi:hypothetical protein